MKQVETFRRNLTEDQVLAVKNERKRSIYNDIAKKERIERRNTMASLGRPKKPCTAYLLFRLKLVATESTAEIAAKWAKLPESEKSVYLKKAVELREKYQLVFRMYSCLISRSWQFIFYDFSKDMEAWENQMISQGNEHLVRGKTVSALKKAGKQSKKE